MPVQINEVIIRAVVDTAPSQSTTQPDSLGERSTTTEAALLENILEIIKEKGER